MINEKRWSRIKEQRSNSIIIELFFHIETKPEKYHTSDEESQPANQPKHQKPNITNAQPTKCVNERSVKFICSQLVNDFVRVIKIQIDRCL